MPRAFLTFLLATHRYSARLHQSIGSCLRWFTLAMACLVLIVLVARAFDIGSIALQESLSYLHATVFMLCLGYTGLHDAQVRVDIFYRSYNTERKAWVNLLGNLAFLLPFSLFMTLISAETALNSWDVRESSVNAGGLPLVYLLRSLPVVGGALLTVFALGDIARLLVEVSTVNSNADNGREYDA